MVFVAHAGAGAREGGAGAPCNARGRGRGAWALSRYASSAAVRGIAAGSGLRSSGSSVLATGRGPPSAAWHARAWSADAWALRRARGGGSCGGGVVWFRTCTQTCGGSGWGPACRSDSRVFIDARDENRKAKMGVRARTCAAQAGRPRSGGGVGGRGLARRAVPPHPPSPPCSREPLVSTLDLPCRHELANGHGP